LPDAGGEPASAAVARERDPFYTRRGSSLRDVRRVMDDAEPRGVPKGPGTIRPVTRGDMPGLKAVVGANGLFPPGVLDDMTAIYSSGDGPDDFWLTADDGGGPLAVAHCAPERMTQGTWNLLLVAVRPPRQGQGVGAALVRHVEDALKARGERVLLVETSGLPDFERARAFYRRLGYDEEARIRGFYRAGEDKVIFRKALDAPT
jgi:GNAT superfamily N-acetyltransferase